MATTPDPCGARRAGRPEPPAASSFTRMRAAILGLLLLSCAGARTGTAQARRWPPNMRASVLLQCQAQMGEGKFCECLTDKLEVISPDPDSEFTPNDIQTGMAACRRFQPASAPI